MDDGGPAFPFTGMKIGYNDEKPKWVTGMSLRDWFAGMALTSLDHGEIGKMAAGRKMKAVDVMAGLAYEFADAMLKERKNERSNQTDAKT